MLSNHDCEVCAEQGWCPNNDFDSPEVVHVVITYPNGGTANFRFVPGSVLVTTRYAEPDWDAIRLGTAQARTANDVIQYVIAGQPAPDRQGHMVIIRTTQGET